MQFSKFDFKRKQELVIQTLKSTSVSPFVAYQMYLLKEMDRNEEKFSNLVRYRQALNKVVSFEDFIFDVCLNLYQYASIIASNYNSVTAEKQVYPMFGCFHKNISALIGSVRCALGECPTSMLAFLRYLWRAPVHSDRKAKKKFVLGKSSWQWLPKHHR